MPETAWTPAPAWATRTDAVPIYEYRCLACRRKTSAFVRAIGATPANLACAHCGGRSLERAVSSFAHHKAMQGVWDASGPPSMNNSDEYYKDPRNIGRWTEQRLEQLGVDMPQETRQMIDAARDGTMPPPVSDL